LPITLALAVENGFIGSDEQVALLGIGSGINCVMLAVDWQRTPAIGRAIAGRPHFAGLSQATGATADYANVENAAE
jgi:hypothetical protein